MILSTGAPIPTCDFRTEFDCGGGNCIPLSQVCDKRQHCPDGEDEPVGRCGINECNENNGGCNQRCVDTPSSFYCDCNHGYKLVDNTTCKGKSSRDQRVVQKPPLLCRSFNINNLFVALQT